MGRLSEAQSASASKREAASSAEGGLARGGARARAREDRAWVRTRKEDDDVDEHADAPSAALCVNVVADMARVWK